MDPVRDRFEVLLVRGRDQRALDDRQASALCTEVIAVADLVADARQAAQALCALSVDSITFGRVDDAAVLAEAALARFAPPEPELWQGEAWSVLGAARRAQVRNVEAAAHARKVIEIARRLGATLLEASAYNNLGLVSYSAGAPDEALGHYLEALALMEPFDTPEAIHLRIVLNSNAADLHTEARDHLRAAEYLGLALEQVRRTDTPLIAVRLGRKRLGSLRRAGRLDEARAQLAETLPVLADPRIFGGVTDQVRGEEALLAGDREAAAVFLRRAFVQEATTCSPRRNARIGLDLAEVLPPEDDEAFALALAARACTDGSGGSSGMRCDALELLSVQYEVRGELGAALGCLREAAALQRGLLDQARRRQQAELQARFDVNQRAWEARFHRARSEELARHVDERTRELQAANHDLQVARDRAEAADRMKTGFLAAASHELRTPLNAIIGYGEIIREELAESDPRELVESADRLLGSAAGLLRLVDRILQMTDLEAGTTRARPGPIAVPDLLAEVVREVERGAGRHGNRIVWACAPDIGVPFTDGTLLRSVLFNLVENADKFTTAGEVRLCARREGTQLVLAVHDTGIGMSAAEIARLFQLFTQIESGFTRRFGGLGLGLALGRRYCRLLGGELTVQSEPGRGAVFEVRVPFVLDADGAALP